MAEAIINSTRTTGKVFIGVAAKDEEENDRKDHDVHQESHYSVHSSDNDMKGNPRNEQPARPLAAVKHEHSGDDLKDA